MLGLLMKTPNNYFIVYLVSIKNIKLILKFIVFREGKSWECRTALPNFTLFDQNKSFMYFKYFIPVNMMESHHR